MPSFQQPRTLSVPFEVRVRKGMAHNGQVRARWNTRHFPMPPGWHGRLKRCPQCGGRTMVSNLALCEYETMLVLEKAMVCPTCDGTGVVKQQRRR